ncbi:hypothetical protein BBJ28_00006600 [Nothophytophthora sp. Chile5]|nr:hypothetical protein BBJ28_00006600 [Nothophytophthora sp. Chile5]
MQVQQSNTILEASGSARIVRNDKNANSLDRDNSRLQHETNRSTTEVSQPHNADFVGLLDIFSFEDMAEISFDQLWINYINEALQHQFNQALLRPTHFEVAHYANRVTHFASSFMAKNKDYFRESAARLLVETFIPLIQALTIDFVDAEDGSDQQMEGRGGHNLCCAKLVIAAVSVCSQF